MLTFIDDNATLQDPLVLQPQYVKVLESLALTSNITLIHSLILRCFSDKWKRFNVNFFLLLLLHRSSISHLLFIK